ncbi:hypothetical protein HPP92_007957 [Vanilla planifolia]|uniref:Uncharacterized protein n=1 Tax=Vanilla planifolia TaxID=51239 RepID=A0A835V868_VANPL|nr:hypothetical protein HPP92_007957 [Vanilla planifolia]
MPQAKQPSGQATKQPARKEEKSFPTHIQPPKTTRKQKCSEKEETLTLPAANRYIHRR